MTTLNVQFSDASETAIISYFGSPQDAEVWRDVGEVESSDPRWKAYYDAQLISIQEVLPLPT
jgi:hypothetical protein